MNAYKKKEYIPKSDPSSKPLSKAELALLLSLKKKKGRKAEKLYLAEGVRLLEEALKRKIKPKILFYYEPELSERGLAALAAFRAKKVESQSLSSRDFHRLADTEQPQGLIAVFPLPNTSFQTRKLENSSRALIIENLSDPGNVGSIIRSAVGFGFDPIMFLGECVEPFNPKLVRSTVGAIFSNQIIEISLENLETLKSQLGLRVLVTELSGESEESWLALDSNSDTSSKPSPIALAIGSESEGASEELLSLADQRIRISHSKQIESLNASIAAAIVMHQIHLSTSQPEPGTNKKAPRKSPQKHGRKNTKPKN